MSTIATISSQGSGPASTIVNFDELPNDFLVLIFKEKVFTLWDLSVFSSICKRWKIVVRSNQTMGLYRELLEIILHKKSNTQEDWLWVKENYYPKCEIFFHTLSANAVFHNKLSEVEQDYDKVQTVISNISRLGCSPTIWPIKSSITFSFKHIEACLIDCMNKKFSLPIGDFSNWSILAARLTAYYIQNQKSRPIKTLIIVINEQLQTSREHTTLKQQIALQIEKIFFTPSMQNNLLLQIIELNSKSSALLQIATTLYLEYPLNRTHQNNLKKCVQFISYRDGKLILEANRLGVDDRLGTTIEEQNIQKEDQNEFNDDDMPPSKYRRLNDGTAL